MDLSAREFNTLYLLLMNRKRVMTFETIAYHVWGEEYVENELMILSLGMFLSDMTAGSFCMT